MMKKLHLILTLTLVAVFGLGLNAQPASGYYKIEGNSGKFVNVVSDHYAQPNVDEAAATTIYVGVGNEWAADANGLYSANGTKDGSYMLTSLSGKGVEVYSYVNKAVTLANAYVDYLVTRTNGKQLTDADAAVAKDNIKKYAEGAAFLRVKANADVWQLLVTIPEVPAIANEKAKSYGVAEVIEDGKDLTAWNWAVRQVKEHMGRLSDFGLEGFKSLIEANIDKIKPGNTYYLTDDNDGTFGYTTDATDDATAWTMHETEAPVSNGTYKIANKGTGNYVQVLSKAYAKPNATIDAATDITIGLGEYWTVDENGLYSLAGQPDGSIKVVSLKGNTPEGETVEVYDYVGKCVNLANAYITYLKTRTDKTQLSAEDAETAINTVKYYAENEAFVRIIPLGNNEVQLMATVPAIPDWVEAKAREYGVTDGAWNWAVRQVYEHIDRLEGFELGEFKDLIYNNLKNIVPGTTYYLTADAQDGTFNYETAANVAGVGNYAIWSLDKQEVENDECPIATGYYKIKNKAVRNSYVSVKSSTYAKPDATQDDATVIYVGMGDEWGAKEGNEVGKTWTVTSLSGATPDGKNVQVYSYVNYAVELANAFINTHMTKVGNPLTDEEVAQALEQVKYYADNYAFMRLQPVNGSSKEVYAIATIPAVPQWVNDKAVEHGVTRLLNDNGIDVTAWDWACRQVEKYIDRLGEFGLGDFKALVSNNLRNIQHGTTYFLTRDTDGTFGYKPFSDLTSAGRGIAYWIWQLEEVEAQACVESGYYRIKNARGANGKAYVNVDGRYTAEPDATADEAVNEAGTVIYLGTEGMPNGKTKVTGLSAQSDDVIAYANKAIELAYGFAKTALEEALANTNSSSLKEGKDMLLGMLDSYKETWTKDYAYLYMVPSITGSREDAVTCQVTLPGLTELDKLVAGMFQGKSGKTIASDFANDHLFRTNPAGFIMGLDTVGVWNYAVTKLIAGLEKRGTDAGLQTLVKNHLGNVKTGHTYCLTQDDDATFGYADLCETTLEELGDKALWVLEPVKNDGKYFAVNGDFSGNDENGDLKYVNTLYTDFSYTLPEGTKAYKVTGVEGKRVVSGGKKVRYYYLITKEEVASPVPANSAVLLISDNEEMKLEPTGVPAWYSNNAAAGARRRVASTNYAENNGNYLYADHFNTTEATTSHYYALTQGSTQSGAVHGVAFATKVTEVDGNTPVLDATDDMFTSIDEEIRANVGKDNVSDGEKAYLETYYVFPVEENISDGISTAIDDINAANVASVKYVNVAGQSASEAFSGVNIVITTYTDGTQSVAKVVK